MGKAGSRLNRNSTRFAWIRKLDTAKSEGGAPKGFHHHPVPGNGHVQGAHHQYDKQVHRRPGQGDQEFLPGFFRHSLQAGHATDRIQRDVTGAHSEVLGR